MPTNDASSSLLDQFFRPQGGVPAVGETTGGASSTYPAFMSPNLRTNIQATLTAPDAPSAPVHAKRKCKKKKKHASVAKKKHCKKHKKK
jgi:hypothetical protein